VPLGLRGYERIDAVRRRVYVWEAGIDGAIRHVDLRGEVPAAPVTVLDGRYMASFAVDE
jgi:hypothetical protein